MGKKVVNTFDKNTFCKFQTLCGLNLLTPLEVRSSVLVLHFSEPSEDTDNKFVISDLITLRFL